MNKATIPIDIKRAIHHPFFPKKVNICTNKQIPKIKTKDFDPDEKPHKTKARKRKIEEILTYHFAE